jgi:hypothetical protein
MLIKYHQYSRKDVHEIFAPETPFIPQAGTWGLQGIIPIPNRPGDFVFFVTFGQRQGDHVFDEGITHNGVLTWQSQPKQKLSDNQIQQFIHHNEDLNSLYLFLRPAARLEYTYLGQLKYLSHDADREQPVYFQWQILDWETSDTVLEKLGIQLTVTDNAGASNNQSEKTGTVDGIALIETSPPTINASTGNPQQTLEFKVRKAADYSRKEARDRRIGNAGEVAIYNSERRKLLKSGRADLADKVRHVSIEEGDGAGYDIESYTLDGSKKYIEVKTTTCGIDTDFYLTARELEFSKQHPTDFYLYRVYDYDAAKGQGKVFIVNGEVSAKFRLVPTEFRAKIK